MNGKHSVAIWAGAAALFANLAAINLLRLLGGNTADRATQISVALFTAVFVAGSVYSKERLGEARVAKKERRIAELEQQLAERRDEPKRPDGPL